jgi:hypothetical protein
MATLEIKARDVTGTLGNAQHMYFVYTDDVGVQTAFSAFPGENDNLSMLHADINVEVERYNAGDSDDYDPTLASNYNGNESPHFSMAIAAGSDADLKPLLDAMSTEKDRINSEGYDYGVPIFDTFWPNSNIGNGVIDNDSNSNTVAMHLAKVIGQEDLVKKFIKDNELNVPGAEAQLQHGNINQLIQWAKGLVSSDSDSSADTDTGTGNEGHLNFLQTSIDNKQCAIQPIKWLSITKWNDKINKLELELSFKHGYNEGLHT